MTLQTMFSQTRVRRNYALPHSRHPADKAPLDRLGLEESDADGEGEAEDDTDDTDI